METITYTPTRRATNFNLIFGGCFAVFGALFALVGCVVGVAILIFFADRLTEMSGVLFLPCCFLPLGILFMVVGLWLAFGAGRGDKVELSADSLTLTEGNKVTSLQVSEINKLVVHEAWQKRVRYFYVRLENVRGEFIDLEVTQDNYIGAFDVQRILTDLLPRLSKAQMDPKIKKYLETGRIE